MAGEEGESWRTRWGPKGRLALPVLPASHGWQGPRGLPRHRREACGFGRWAVPKNSCGFQYPASSLGPCVARTHPQGTARRPYLRRRCQPRLNRPRLHQLRGDINGAWPGSGRPGPTSAAIGLDEAVLHAGHRLRVCRDAARRAVCRELAPASLRNDCACSVPCSRCPTSLGDRQRTPPGANKSGDPQERNRLNGPRGSPQGRNRPRGLGFGRNTASRRLRGGSKPDGPHRAPDPTRQGKGGGGEQEQARGDNAGLQETPPGPHPCTPGDPVRPMASHRVAQYPSRRARTCAKRPSGGRRGTSPGAALNHSANTAQCK